MEETPPRPTKRDTQIRVLIYLAAILIGAAAGDLLIHGVLQTTFTLGFEQAFPNGDAAGATPDPSALKALKTIVVGGHRLFSTNDRYLWLEAVILIVPIAICTALARVADSRRSRAANENQPAR